MGTNTSKRESGLELLRIIAAMMVMISHLSGTVLNHIDVVSNLLVVRILLSMSVPAVDIFILITGYFSWKNNRRTIGKPLNLILMLLVFTLGSYLLQIALGRASFSVDQLIHYSFPFNYFVTLFVALYFISPYINKLLSFETWGGLRFITIGIVLFSVWPILIDIIQEFLGKTLEGASTISRLGSQNGYNIVNFILMYCIGAFLSYGDIEHKPHSSLIAIFMGIVSICVIFLWSWFGVKMPGYANSAYSYHNPFVIMQAVAFFLLFKNLKFSVMIINRLAKAAFAAFLLHPHLFQFLHCQFHVTLPWYFFVVWMLVCVVVLYFIAWGIWEVYNFFTKFIFDRINKIEIRYN